ncbi:MAG TPA: hypothetical protein VI729_09500, partial [Anaerolineales bacterium]|nr:hypothetical protein [Anaerolineales bacterium]
LIEAITYAIPGLLESKKAQADYKSKQADRALKQKAQELAERKLRMEEQDRAEILEGRQRQKQGIQQALQIIREAQPRDVSVAPEAGPPELGAGGQGEPGFTAQMPAQPINQGRLMEAIMQASPEKGIEAMLPKPNQGFTLGPGQTRYGPGGAQVATIPPAPERPVPVAPGGRLVRPGTGEEVFTAPPKPEEPQKPPQPPTVYAAGRELGFPEEMKAWTQDQWTQANKRAAEIEGLKTKERALGGLSDEVIAQRAKQAREIEKVRESFVQSKAYLGAVGRLKAQMVEVEPGVSVATRIEELKNAGRPLQAGIAQDVVRYENYIRAGETLRKEFTDAEILQYVGYGKYQANQLSQFVKTDPKFMRFMTLNEQMRGTAFGEGGKQLTPFEASVVFGYTPSGREAWGEYYIAKMDEIVPRYRTLLQETLTVGTTPRGQFTPQYGPGARKPGGAPAATGPSGPKIRSIVPIR